MSDKIQPAMAYYIVENILSSTGMYPASNNGVPRDKYGDGWNDALLTITKAQTLMYDWLKNLDTNYRVLVQRLVCDEVITLDYSLIEGTVDMIINVNDIFAPAADCEYVYLMEMVHIENLYCKYSTDGLYAWVSAKRDWALPRPRYRNEKFQFAVEDIKANIQFPLKGN